MSTDFVAEVNWFSLKMQEKLSKPRNLSKSHWGAMSASELFERIIDEVEELRDAIEGAASECCDIANFCMMMADNYCRSASFRETQP